MQDKSKAIVRALAFCALTLLSAHQVIAQRQKLPTPEKLSDGIVVHLGDSTLNVEVCTDSVIRVAFAKDRTFFARWYFGGESHPAYQTMLKFDRLRYRLLPLST